MFRAMVKGAFAGAAGTTALNAATYLDMAVQARPASETPQLAVEELGKRTGHPLPGTGDERSNRLAGLGPLPGAATGVAVGAVAGLLDPALRRLPPPLSALLLGAAAMAASNAPMTRRGLTDPARWSKTEWASDAIPHLAYGLVTTATQRSAH
jgi:hypothetical protein